MINTLLSTNTNGILAVVLVVLAVIAVILISNIKIVSLFPF